MPRKSVPSAETKLAPVLSYREMHENEVINRLRRIEGQVRGLIDMIQGGRSCEEVALQMSAARKAMDKTFYRMMACSLMEAVNKAESSSQTIADVERAAAILEKFG